MENLNETIITYLIIMQYIPDNPLDSYQYDELRRENFINSLLKLIQYGWNAQDNKSSVVLGIEWKWGDGKTTILKFLEEKLEEEDTIEVMWFEPWLYNKDVDIHTKFFDELASTLWSSKKIKLDETQIRQIEQYSKIIWPFQDPTWDTVKGKVGNYLVDGFITIGVFACTVATNITWKAVSFILTFLITSRRKIISTRVNIKITRILKNKVDLEQQRDNISHILSSKEKKLIVIIDDIDRLESEQLKVILQIVKSSANFPNVIYILSYDREIVENVISNLYGKENNYLDKIIQLPVSLPLVREEIITEILDKHLEQFLEYIKSFWRKTLTKEETSELTNLFVKGYKFFFKNIRDIKKYINLLYVDFLTLQSKYSWPEINIIDFLIIEAFKLFTKPLFYFLYYQKNNLFSYRGKDDALTPLQEIFDDFLKNRNLLEYKELLYELFPQFNKRNYGIETTEEIQNRVCSKKSFHKYFELDIFWTPNSEFIEFRERIKKWQMSQAIKIFKKVENEGWAYEFIDRIGKVLLIDNKETLSEVEIVALLLFLINNEKNIDFKPLGLFDSLYGPEVIIMRSIYQSMLRYYDNKDIFLEIMYALIEGADDIWQVCRYFRNHLRDEKNEERTKIEDIKLQERLGDDINSILDKINLKIKNLLKSGKILDQISRRFILYFYATISGKQKQVLNRVKNISQNITTLNKFYKSYFTKSHSQTMPMFSWDKMGPLKEKISFDIKGLTEWRKLWKIEKDLSKLYSHNLLTEHEFQLAQKTIEAFKNNKEYDDDNYDD